MHRDSRFYQICQQCHFNPKLSLLFRLLTTHM